MDKEQVNNIQHTASHCNTLQHNANVHNASARLIKFLFTKSKSTHCNTLQHTATHCNTLQHNVAHYYTLHTCMTRRKSEEAPIHNEQINTLQHIATHFNTLQHTSESPMKHTFTKSKSTHCNILQHTATHSVAHCNTL